MKNEKTITKTIDYFSLGHPLAGFRSHYALKARTHMFDLFMEVMKPTASTSVLDLGVTPDQSLPESNFFEKLYPYKDRLVTASIEDATFLEGIYPGVKFVKTYPDGPLPFEDKQFDILFCSAVIEHVGSRDSQRMFIQECVRVSRNFFFTTPNRMFPLDLHTLLPFLHWFPQSFHQASLRRLGLDFWAKTENLNLFTPKALKTLFPKCKSLQIYNVRLFGWPSNIVVYGSSE